MRRPSPRTISPLVTSWSSFCSPPSAVAKLLPRKVGVAAVGSVEWAPPPSGARNLRTGLTARCRKKPLAVLLDEAHTLDLEVGRTLLNASQQVRDQAPFLLVLAGTPGLPSHLGAMNVSFWSRLGKGRLGIGLLGAADTRAALVEPLAAHGVCIDVDALNSVVEDSQCYPYFVQLWGEALWDQRLETGETRLTAAHAGCGSDRGSGPGYGLLPRPLSRAGDSRACWLLPWRRHRCSRPAPRPPFPITRSDSALAVTGADAEGRLAAREGFCIGSATSGTRRANGRRSSGSPVSPR